MGETTALSLTVATPSTAGNAVYKVKTIGNVSDYDSVLSSASATVTVENPRSAGALNKSSVTMDGVSIIQLTVPPSNAAYSHKVIWWTTAARKTTDKVEQTLAVGIKSATLNPVPLNWCNAYTGRPPYIANCTLETYNGAVKIGELNYTFGVIVPTDIKPTVLLAVEPVDGLGGLYVRLKSKAKLTATAAGSYSSDIESYAMTGNGQSGTTNPWTTPYAYAFDGTHEVSVMVTDTRGRTATELVTITVMAYNRPSIDPITAERCTDNGTLDSDGTYIKLAAGLKVSSVGGNNAIVTSVAKYRNTGGSTWVNGDTAFDGEAILGTGNFAITNAYEIEVTITDTVGNTSTRRLTVLASDRLFDFRTDRASIGRVAGPVANTFILPDGWTTNLNADKLEGYHVSDLVFGNPNLLHNWDFRNAINQRGVSGTITTTTYFYDRWIRSGGTVTLNPTYLTVFGSLSQKIENVFKNKDLTLSVMINDVVYSVTATTNSTGIKTGIMAWFDNNITLA